MREVATPDGGRIATSTLGRGSAPPLLLCRPLGGSMASWDAFAGLLSESTQVIMFDARGTGESSRAPASTTTRAMARDAVAVLDALAVPQAHVYGISLGGMVASWLAIDAPSRVSGLVLASTAARGLHLHDVSGRSFALARCFAKRAPETEACMATRILSREFRRDHPLEVDRIRQLAREHPASHRSLAILIAAVLRHDVRGRLAEIASTTLVLAGDRDELLDEAPQRDLAKGIPGARMTIVPGVGHDISTEAPRDVAARVLAHVMSC